MRALPTIFAVSDLHLDYGPYEWPAAAHEADVVVVAGDVSNGKFDIEFFSKLNKPVVIVPGNNDLWSADGQDMLEIVAAMKRSAEGTQVHILWDETVILAGARFIGTPLWNDFGKGNEELMRAAFAHSRDYEYINAKSWYANPENLKLHQESGGSRFTRRDGVDAAVSGAFTPIVAYSLHQKSLNFITEELEQSFDGPTVLVTHRAPTFQSLRLGHTVREHYLDSQFWHCRGMDNSDLARVGIYAADLPDLFERYRHELDLAIHGHTSSVDFVEGSTRVVANPRGRYSGPVTESERSSYRLLGYAMSDADVAANHERFKEYPYWGDNNAFEPEKLIRLSDGLAPAIATVIDEYLPRMLELYDELRELAVHAGHDVPLIAQSVQESVTARAEEFCESLAKIGAYAEAVFDVKAVFGPDPWYRVSRAVGAPTAQSSLVPRFTRVFDEDPVIDAVQAVGDSLDAMAQLLEFLPTLPQTPERMRLHYAERIRVCQAHLEAAGYPGSINAHAPVDFWRKLYFDLGSVTIAAPGDVARELHQEIDKILNGPRMPRSVAVYVHAAGADECGMFEKQGTW